MGRYFAWKAINANGVVQRGIWEGENEEQIKEHLHQAGYMLLRLHPGRWRLKWSKGSLQRHTFWISLTRRLGSLLAAGIPLLPALDLLSRHEAAGRGRDQFITLKEEVEAGGKLSEALLHLSPPPSPLIRSMVRAGEHSGQLVPALTQITAQLEQESYYKRKLMNALAYPLLLLGFTALAVLVLSLWVLPIYDKLYAGFQAELPWLTRMVFRGGALIPYILAIGLATGLVIIVISRVKSGVDLHSAWERWKRQLPGMGELYRWSDLAQCSAMLSSLLRAGVPILEAFHLAAENTSSPDLRGLLERTHEGVKQGMSVISMMGTNPRCFPPMACDLLAIGEKTGQLDEMFDQLANIYRQEIELRMGVIVRIAEPVLVLFSAVMIGTLAIGVLLPALTMNTYIQ